MPLSLPILHTDKLFLNLRAITCRHCLSGFWVNSCPKGVHDSCLTGLKGERESPSGHEKTFIEPRAGGSGREHNNGLFEIWSSLFLSFTRCRLSISPFFSSPFSAKRDKIPSFPHLPFTALPTPFWLAQHLSTTSPWGSPRTSESPRGCVSALILFALSATSSHCFLLRLFLFATPDLCFIFSPYPRVLTSKHYSNRLPYPLIGLASESPGRRLDEERRERSGYLFPCLFFTKLQLSSCWADPPDSHSSSGFR